MIHRYDVIVMKVGKVYPQDLFLSFIIIQQPPYLFSKIAICIIMSACCILFRTTYNLLFVNVQTISIQPLTHRAPIN